MTVILSRTGGFSVRCKREDSELVSYLHRFNFKWSEARKCMFKKEIADEDWRQIVRHVKGLNKERSTSSHKVVTQFLKEHSRTLSELRNFSDMNALDIKIFKPDRRSGFLVHMPYEKDRVALIKEIEGAKWDDTLKSWVIPLFEAPELLNRLNGLVQG